MSRLKFFLLALLLLSLAACQAGGGPGKPPPPSPTSSNRSTPETAGTPTPTRLPRYDPANPGESSPDAEASPTVVLAARTLEASTEAPPEGYDSGSLPTPAPDPLRIVFPTPGKAPASGWRPALYPVPWAQFPYDHFYFARPIAADEVNWPLWEYRYGGHFFEDVIHTGIDITAPKGTPVLAAGSGKVVWAGYGIYLGYVDYSDPYGLSVVIHHDFGYQNQELYTLYGHLNQVDVAIGQQIDMGDVLGLSGETGFTTGPHLHFEVRVGANSFFSTRNPELWLSPPQGWGIIAGRVMNSNSLLVPGQTVIFTSRANGQNWIAWTYGTEPVNSDPYYQENLVVSDLPAGFYDIRIPYAGLEFVQTIEVFPGVVNFFSFTGLRGFDMELPPTPGADFTPAPEPTASPAP